jgi:hypothetical protein
MSKVPIDKIYHFTAGYVTAISIGVLFEPILGMAAATLSGVLKECYDYYDYGLYDEKDMFFTWGGGLVGYGVALLAQQCMKG